jgi:NAD(P)-dependent dehydrogenase (short-subunit alcohol dehydrogenase family)
VQRFEQKTVVVVGGASGIGAACVRRLLDEGANVVIVDLDEARVAAAVNEYADAARVVGVAADISDASSAENAIDACKEHFGVPFGLINSAGIRGVGSILTTEPDLFHRNLQVNLAGSYNTCRAFARLLVNAGLGGAIVNVSSAAGVQAVPNRVAYVSAKHGVVGLTRAAAMELGHLGIRVNAVAPGTVHTPMTAPMFVDPANVERIRATHPIGREGTAEEIAAAILFLLSDDASFILGAVLCVDGGSTVGQASH